MSVSPAIDQFLPEARCDESLARSAVAVSCVVDVQGWHCAAIEVAGRQLLLDRMQLIDRRVDCCDAAMRLNQMRLLVQSPCEAPVVQLLV